MSRSGDRSDEPTSGGWVSPPVGEAALSPPYQPPIVAPPTGPASVVRRSDKPRRDSGKMLKVAGALVVVGLVLSAPGMLAGWSMVSQLTSLERHDVPGSFTVDLDEPGNYSIFVRTGLQQQPGMITTSSNIAVRLGDVSVLDSLGETVSTESETNYFLQIEDESFTTVYSFDVARSAYTPSPWTPTLPRWQW